MNPCYQRAYQQLSAQSSAWLYAARAAHFTAFLARGFPTRSEEDWRYTDISAIKQAQFSLSLPADALDDTVAMAKIQQYIVPEYQNLVFINGHFAPQLSDRHVANGAIATSLMSSVHDHPELLTPYFRLEPGKQLLFSQLNVALMTDGLVLYVPRNTQVEKPIHLLHFVTQTDAEPMHHLRNLIILEENTEAAFFETYASDTGALGTGQKYFNNIVTQIYVNENAKLDYCKKQQEGPQAYHIANTQIIQQRHTRVNACNFSWGGQLGRDDLMIEQNGEDAVSELYGLYMLRDNQHMDHHTHVDHRSAHGSSRQLYKGVLSGKSTAVFNGKIKVQKSAKSVNAQQTNQNLLLSNSAAINTKPALEIYANDVKCMHGATVGQIDAAALFYLRSRGIDEKTAMSLLVQAFMNAVVEEVPAAIKQYRGDNYEYRHAL